MRWSDDDVVGDREVMEVYPADDKDELTPLEMPRPPNPEALKTYRVTWVIEVEADTPLNAARRAYQTRPGTLAYDVSEVCLCAAECHGPPVTIDLNPRRRLSLRPGEPRGALCAGPRGLLPQARSAIASRLTGLSPRHARCG
jgi:hypothetical protein